MTLPTNIGLPAFVMKAENAVGWLCAEVPMHYSLAFANASREGQVHCNNGQRKGKGGYNQLITLMWLVVVAGGVICKCVRWLGPPHVWHIHIAEN